MTLSHQTIPVFYLSRAASAERLAVAARGHNVTVTVRLLAVVARWLLAFPALNGSYVDGAALQSHSVDLGVALAHAENVLVVPTLSDCGAWPVSRFDDELRGLRERSSANAFDGRDFVPGSFTVSNLGSSGVESFTSLINPPQVAILSVAALAPRPVVRQGKLTVERTLPLTLGVDHRAADGAYAAAALAGLIRDIEVIDSSA
jgi:pyruvate dehydrogenase E2 component (dihydrolipoamide acetyltransferase)